MGFCTENIEIFGKYFMKITKILKFPIQNTKFFEKIGIITHYLKNSQYLLQIFGIAPSISNSHIWIVKFKIFGNGFTRALSFFHTRCIFGHTCNCLSHEKYAIFTLTVPKNLNVCSSSLQISFTLLPNVS